MSEEDSLIAAEQDENEVSIDYSKLSTVDLVHQMHRLRLKIDSLELSAKSLRKQHDLIAKGLLPDRMAEEGLEQIVVAGVGRVNVRADVYASIPEEQKFEAWQWLRDNGRSNLISETVNASSLKAAIRAAIIKGEPFPEEYFKVTPYSMAVITKTR